MDGAELKLDEERYGRVPWAAAKIRLVKKSLGITCDFDVKFRIDLACSRCLAVFSKEMRAQLHLDYLEGSDPLLNCEKVELRPGDIDRIFFHGPFIDISIGIREAIALNVPAAPVCKEGCLGLCPVCGRNLNKGKCKCKVKQEGIFTPVKIPK
jgi:uncharacterized protein